MRYKRKPLLVSMAIFSLLCSPINNKKSISDNIRKKANLNNSVVITNAGTGSGSGQTVYEISYNSFKNLRTSGKYGFVFGYEYFDRRILLYESTIFNYTNNDEYLGLSIKSHEKVSIGVTVGETEFYSDGYAISGGCAISVEHGVKILGLGASVGLEVEADMEKANETSYSISIDTTLLIESSETPTDYYLYSREYKTDMILVSYLNGSFEKAVMIEDEISCLKKYAFLEKKPIPATPLAYKC